MNLPVHVEPQVLTFRSHDFVLPSCILIIVIRRHPMTSRHWIVASLLSICAAVALSAQGMRITSPAFDNNGSIPAKFTCDGAGMNPALQFSGVPAAAKSLALIVEDPDVPKNLKADGLFEHWLMWDIAPDSKGCAEGAGKGGINETGSAGFMGPCPRTANTGILQTVRPGRQADGREDFD